MIAIYVVSSIWAQPSGLENQFKIYDSKNHSEVKFPDFIKSVKPADVVFFGEEHNDSVGHYLEHRIFISLIEEFGNRQALSLEMFERDVQEVMNEYLNGFIKEKHFKKDARVWSNYKDYRPLVETAKEKQASVVCANAPSRYANLAGRRGPEELNKLGKGSKRYFAPLPYDTASGLYWQKLTGVNLHGSTDTGVHIPVANPMAGFNLVAAQSLWDATMGYSISQFRKENPEKKVLQINGRFHSDERFAAVTQFSKYRPKDKTIVISCFPSEDFENPEWNKHAGLADFIILTNPAIPKTYEP